MKHGLYILTMPVLWSLQILLLVAMIIIHVVAAPIRAFIYWGRALKSLPGWGGIFEGGNNEFGLWTAPRKSVEISALDEEAHRGNNSRS